MTQATDTDIRDIKTLIDNLTKVTESIARSTEANTKAIADLTLEMRTGFTSINGKFDTVNARLTNVETNTKVVFDLTEKVGELKTGNRSRLWSLPPQSVARSLGTFGAATHSKEQSK
jgi:hypothetical protein